MVTTRCHAPEHPWVFFIELPLDTFESVTTRRWGTAFLTQAPCKNPSQPSNNGGKRIRAKQALARYLQNSDRIAPGQCVKWSAEGLLSSLPSLLLSLFAG